MLISASVGIYRHVMMNQENVTRQKKDKKKEFIILVLVKDLFLLGVRGVNNE